MDLNICMNNEILKLAYVTVLVVNYGISNTTVLETQ